MFKNGKSFLGEKGFYSICQLEDFSKSIKLPVLFPETIVGLNGSINLYSVDKSTEISFNYLSGNVSYIVKLKSLISEQIAETCSLKDIANIF